MILNAIKGSFRNFWYLWVFELFSISCFISVFIPPSLFWPAVFTSYTIPAVLILNLVLLIALPFWKLKLIPYPLIALILGFPFFLITISYKSDVQFTGSELSILSFNTKFFRGPGTYSDFSLPMIKWVAADTSKIKCIQEYSTNPSLPEIDVTKQIKDQGYHSFVFSPKTKDREHNPGMAIFTVYHVLDSGVIWYSENSFNAILYADMQIGNDTVRIYNVHLESMGLDIHQYRDPSQYDSKLKSLISRLKRGAQQREAQIDKLIHHSSKSPYPIIICGDFNDTPYSYNYFTLRRYFSNAFEKAGNGFGFTFNSLLFFLRIDHHFYGDGIEALDFRVDRSMKTSDHFPTRGIYKTTHKPK